MPGGDKTGQAGVDRVTGRTKESVKICFYSRVETANNTILRSLKMNESRRGFIGKGAAAAVLAGGVGMLSSCKEEPA